MQQIICWKQIFKVSPYHYLTSSFFLIVLTYRLVCYWGPMRCISWCIISSCFVWVLHCLICFYDLFLFLEHTYLTVGQIKEINVAACSIEILCFKKGNSKKKKSGKKQEGAFEYFIFKNCVWLKFVFDSGNLQTEHYYGQISIQDSFHKWHKIISHNCSYCVMW